MAKARKAKKKKKAKKKAPRKARGQKPKVQKSKQRRVFIYHITKFQERFELKDDVRFCREKPLEYLRFYVGSGRDDEAIAFKQQILLIKASPNRPYLRSAFDDLMESAGNWSRAYRGYILISAEPVQPATESYIAHLVGFDLSHTRKVLKELIQIGLIERVPLPKFDLSLNETPPGKAKKGNGRRGGSGRSRSSSSAHETTRESFKKTETEAGNGSGKPKPNFKTEPDPKKKASAKPTQPAGAKVKQSMTVEQRRERKNQLAQQLRAQGKDKGNHPFPDHHPSEPDYPTESDAGVGKQRKGRPSNPPPSIIDSQIDEFLNNVAGGNRAYYSDEAKQFGSEIFRKLKVTYYPASPQGMSELCCFAGRWDEAVGAKLPPEVLSELWDSSIKDAERIAKMRSKIRFKKSAEATWCHSFNRRLAARKRKQAG